MAALDAENGTVPPVTNATAASPAAVSLKDDLPPIPEVLSPPTVDDATEQQNDHVGDRVPNGRADMAKTEAQDHLNRGAPPEDVSPVENGTPDLPLSPQSQATRPDPARLVDGSSIDTPPMSPSLLGRRGVLFARGEDLVDGTLHTRRGSWDAGDQQSGKSRREGIMSRLKALASQAGPSAPKSPTTIWGFPDAGGVSTAGSPAVGRGGGRLPHTLGEEGSDIDADAEETADETAAEAPPKSKRKTRRMRRRKEDSQSVPGAPTVPQGESDPPVVPRRFNILQRRNTMPDAGDVRAGLSEGEGRDQLARAGALTRGSSWVGRDDAERVESPGAPSRRLGHLRRISGFGGGISDGDAIIPRRPFLKGGGDRASTFGAQKWRQVKKTLKLLRQKKDERFDYFKSAELMAELRAGAPAVLMLASMIARDEHGNKRIPVLLEQVKLSIKDSAPLQDDDSERHMLFIIDLEYGSGPSRMKWTIKRTIGDIYNMHWKYRLALGNEKVLHTRHDLGTRPKQPSFPLSAFPYMRGYRGHRESDDEDQAGPRGDETTGEITAGEMTAAEGTAAEGTATDADDTQRPRPRKLKSRMSVLGARRRPSTMADSDDPSGDRQAQAAMDAVAMRRKYVDRQQRLLEKYLQEMVRWLIFRADSNRLCRFLELSALGVRLAAEGSYHGKECYLHIQSAKGLDFRWVLAPAKVIGRHTRKWFLVRQSYIVCVDSPENMNIYDVYLVDSKFKIISKKNKLKQIGSTKKKGEQADEVDATLESAPEKHHNLSILTSERKVKLWSRNQHLIKQFEESMVEMLRATPWHNQNRFGSFAPVRTGVYAQWLVDGRDYMWNVSRAINMARDVIYIHDWWLSPELYMRRPAAISQKWRLDRLLQRKAREGVKIFVIIYRNVEAAVPIDSEYTKFSLLNLHPNIFVQRSPNQFKKNQFFFAHHEKIIVVDHDVAFVGGIDLCFGRWDCPQHPLADDKPTGFEFTEEPKDAEHCQLFPGKDYSNPRVQDFFRLNEPYEEMHDRSRVPRMPWHDLSMQVVGQPARDLTRHFVQRWNYLRRGRKPTRPTPFLLPPPDYKREDLDALGLSGTCEVQILRSATTWSLGIEETEHSIQSAYVKMIEDSEHFVYIENQFFISSTDVMNTKIYNRIGDALVDRIIRAHENSEDWRAVIIIPLMPGFQNLVDEQDGTSVRLILQCQFRSICRGESSIWGRLRGAGIEPEDYIEFFSLRQWGRIGNDILTTEQLYIHGKTIIVDDRVALIGSANINERSMLGSRDSECAAIVRDTDMLWSTMAGRPFRVGRFAHTLRLRLMREHLGLDVDEILEEERQADLSRQEEFDQEMEGIYSEVSTDASPIAESSSRSLSRKKRDRAPSVNHDVDLQDDMDVDESTSEGRSPAGKPTGGSQMHEQEVEGQGPDHWKDAKEQGVDQGRDSVIINDREVLMHNVMAEGRGSLDSPKVIQQRSYHSSEAVSSRGGDGVSHGGLPPVPAFNRRTTEQLGLPRASQLPTLPPLDDTNIGGQPPSAHLDANGNVAHGGLPNPLAAEFKLADIHKDCMQDPVDPSFYEDVWVRVAENNTRLYRRVFRCQPDSEVTSWHEYDMAKDYGKAFKESMEGKRSSDEHDRASETATEKQAAAGAGIATPGPAVAAKSMFSFFGSKNKDTRPKTTLAADAGQTPTEEKNFQVQGEPEHRPVVEQAAAAADPEKAAAATKEDSNQPDPSSGESPFPTLKEGPPPATPDKAKERRTTVPNVDKPAPTAAAAAAAMGLSGGNQCGPSNVGSVRRRRRAATKGSRRGIPGPDELLTKPEAEEYMGMMQGTLVQFPYDWLIVEENNGNWLYQVDQVAPLQIYN